MSLAMERIALLAMHPLASTPSMATSVRAMRPRDCDNTRAVHPTPRGTLLSSAKAWWRGASGLAGGVHYYAT